MLKSNPAVITSLCRWSASDKELTNQSCQEDPVFKLLPDIFKNEVNAIIANSNSTLNQHNYSAIFLQNPNIAPTSAYRHNMTRPDGYMVLKSRLQGNTLSWADVVLSSEYKHHDQSEDLDDVYLFRTLRYCATLSPHFRMSLSYTENSLSPTPMISDIFRVNSGIT